MPARPRSALGVHDLLDRPGASRPLDLELEVPADVDLPLVEEVSPLRLQGVAEGVVEGILVRGTLTAEVTVGCARCLKPVSVGLSTEVAELYSDPATADEPGDVEAGYELADGEIDLDTLLRDALVPALPQAPLCRPDCQGLCATCGADRNVTTCDCAEDTADHRWAALEGLRLDGGAAN